MKTETERWREIIDNVKKFARESGQKTEREIKDFCIGALAQQVIEKDKVIERMKIVVKDISYRFKEIME